MNSNELILEVLNAMSEMGDRPGLPHPELGGGKLAKNEAKATVFEDGGLRFDFGPSVPESVRRAALRWAKKRGLNPVEASLAKSDGSGSYALFTSNDKQVFSKKLRQVSWFY